MKEKKTEKAVIRGEAALALVLLMNSFGVVLMLYSGSGISAISSVPYAFSEVLPQISLGTWTYLFQGILIASLLALRKKVVISYLLSFAVGFLFGNFIDLNELWIGILPRNLGLRILYFVISYAVLCIGIALSNRCKMPIIPTDLFPRELSFLLKIPYARIKITFDVTCLALTAVLTLVFLGHLDGLGVGTVLAAATMGKGVAVVGAWMDQHVAVKVSHDTAAE